MNNLILQQEHLAPTCGLGIRRAELPKAEIRVKGRIGEVEQEKKKEESKTTEYFRERNGAMVQVTAGLIQGAGAWKTPH